MRARPSLARARVRTHPGLSEAALDAREAAQLEGLGRRRRLLLASRRGVARKLAELAQVVGVVVVAVLRRCRAGERARERRRGGWVRGRARRPSRSRAHEHRAWSAAVERRAGGGGGGAAAAAPAAARNAPGGPCMSSLTESFVSRRRTLAALTER
jgi:hypothetical protein